MAGQVCRPGILMDLEFMLVQQTEAVGCFFPVSKSGLWSPGSPCNRDSYPHHLTVSTATTYPYMGLTLKMSCKGTVAAQYGSLSANRTLQIRHQCFGPCSGNPFPSGSKKHFCLLRWLSSWVSSVPASFDPFCRSFERQDAKDPHLT